jgi:hypothetical protein
LRAEADLVFELLWFAGHGRWRFLRGIFIHGGNSLEGNVRLNTFPGQLLGIGAAARLPAQMPRRLSRLVARRRQYRIACC